MIPLSIHDVSRVFPDGTRALDGVSFTINPGEGTILLGSNGSGKTTLLRCINGLEAPTSGQIYVDNIDVVAAKQRRAHHTLRRVRRQVGMVFQKFHLIGNLGVLQNVLFGGLGRTNNPFNVFSVAASRQERLRAMACLERVGLADLAKRRADSLSGGQQQRVAIARMLMQDPQVVLADEPIASLDPKSGREVMDLLWEIVRERNLTVVCALHQLEIAKEYGDRLVGLRHGTLVMDSPTAEMNSERLHRLYEDINLPKQPVQDKISLS
ncbi:phosphonate ABC transporter ATP-binding protein [Sodalinema gerasimenkoae]|uniref:phosphonate ABC transporter ATP-binding protein n=1 Tax=Sodalinema gerasimenkoae TaxID=2862348 RepID=UPI00135C6B6F|nr:phosphonate ABC transporter ATP-binding protein [Sodalinema gerasimenkoae]